MLTRHSCVERVLEDRAAPEVDELRLAGGQVNEDVLGLDVAVQDAAAGAVPHGLQHLAEQPPRHGLRQEPPLVQQVPEVLTALRTLHDQREAVG